MQVSLVQITDYADECMMVVLNVHLSVSSEVMKDMYGEKRKIKLEVLGHCWKSLKRECRVTLSRTARK